MKFHQFEITVLKIVSLASYSKGFYTYNIQRVKVVLSILVVSHAPLNLPPIKSVVLSAPVCMPMAVHRLSRAARNRGSNSRNLIVAKKHPI